MAIKIDDEVMKEYTERNGLPEVYEAYKGIKNAKDLKRAMKDKMFRSTVEDIEIEQKRNKKIDALNKLREDATLEDATDEELVEYMPETFADINAEKAEVQYGVPANLFPPKEGMSNREWLAVTRENFKRAGLDFDDKEDRQRAAEAAARAEQKESLKEEKDERGILQSLSEGVTTPRTSGKYYEGKPVTTADVVSDALRIAEAAPPVVALPAIVGRNVFDYVTDEDKTLKEAAQDLGADVGGYVAGGGLLGKYLGQGGRLVRGVLRNTFGGQKMGEKALSKLLSGSGEGSRKQVVEATKAALTGGMAGPTNPYAETAVKEVARAGLSDAEKKQGVRVLDKYLAGGEKEGIEKASETLTTTKKVGKGFDKDVKAEAKSLGREALENTSTVKLSFDDVSSGLSEKDAKDLLKKLQSQGLRDMEGKESFVGVSGVKTSNPDEYRIARESEEIEKWFKGHKRAAATFKEEQAAKNVLSTIGTKPSEARGLMKYVAETPVAYEKPLSVQGLKFVAKTSPKILSRYLFPQIPEIIETFETEEKD